MERELMVIFLYVTACSYDLIFWGSRSEIGPLSCIDFGMSLYFPLPVILYDINVQSLDTLDNYGEDWNYLRVCLNYGSGSPN